MGCDSRREVGKFEEKDGCNFRDVVPATHASENGR